MNTSRSLLLGLVIATTTSAVTTFLWQSAGSHGAIPTGGAAENSPARARMELMMLRDPATGTIPGGIRAQEVAFASTLPSRKTNPILLKGARLDVQWTQRGPWWIGGRTRALALDITGEDTIVAGGVSGGLWRSTDAGQSWTRTTLPSQLPTISCVVQDIRPGRTSNWYAGTGELIGNSASGGGAFYHGDGVYKSTDNGRTWTGLASTQTGTPHLFDRVYDNVWRIAIDASDTTRDEIYMAVYGTIARSTDGGLSWTAVLGGLNQKPGSSSYSGYFTEVATTSRGVVYATISGDGWKRGIWRSDDGAAWTVISPPDMPAQFNRVAIGIAPQDENTVYFLAETPGTGALGRNFRGDSSWHQLWRYTYLDGNGSGEHGRWENLTDRLPLFGRPFGDFFSQGSYDLLVRVDPHDSRLVYLGGTNLYRTNNAFADREGISWIGGYQNHPIDSTAFFDYEYPRHHPDLHEVIFSRETPGIMYTGSDGGVHRTEAPGADSVIWTSLNRGLLTTQFYTVAIDPLRPGDYTVAGGMQDNGTWLTRSLEANEPWSVAGSGDGAYCAFDGDSSLYLSKQLGRIYRLIFDDDGNKIGETRVDPAGKYQKDYLFISPFVLDPGDRRIMYLAAGHELMRNSDLTAIGRGSTASTAINWSSLTGSTVPDSLFVTAVGVSAAAPSHRVYFGTNAGRVYRVDDAHVGTPAATDVTGAFPAKGYVSCIAVDPLDGDRAIVVFSNYSVMSLFATTDGGATWASISGNLEANANGTGAGPSCRWAEILHRPNGTVFLVGTSVGLFSTTRLAGMGTTWYHEAADEIGNAVVKMIAVRQSDGFVAVATHGSGMWTTTMSVASAEAGEISGESLLQSIAPNPAREFATVRFNVPPALAGRWMLLRAFDLLGREVARLVDGPAIAGAHSVRLDVRKLGGTRTKHFVRIEIGEKIETRSLDVVRY